MVFSFLALTRWAREPVALICVSPSEAAKGEREELKGARGSREDRVADCGHSTRPNLTSKPGQNDAAITHEYRFSGATLREPSAGRWPGPESKKISTAVSSSAAETGRRTRQSPGAIPVLTKAIPVDSAHDAQPRVRRLNLGIGETDAEDECGSPGEDLRAPVRLGLGRHQPAGRPAAAEM